ncbi:16S rRNA (guanine(966)-N(2))-methyltransferase RsmD [candidate division WOR-3 bacterium]|nr:16S rRNA (guanine(966)-N(2))-methyltransferase RsmD [candidate division WOR-3 bacterium]
MPRITGGEFKGRILRYPKGRRCRPTMDKIKESLFSILGEGIVGARVLDLFAAAGGLGLEALSRGASKVVFVEKNRISCLMLEENINSCDVADRTILVKQDVRIYLKQSDFPATQIFCDPPYNTPLVEETLSLLALNPGVSDKTSIVFEHAADQDLPVTEPLKLKMRREYGDTCLSFIIKSRDGGEK